LVCWQTIQRQQLLLQLLALTPPTPPAVCSSTSTPPPPTIKTKHNNSHNYYNLLSENDSDTADSWLDEEFSPDHITAHREFRNRSYRRHKSQSKGTTKKTYTHSSTIRSNTKRLTQNEVWVDSSNYLHNLVITDDQTVSSHMNTPSAHTSFSPCQLVSAGSRLRIPQETLTPAQLTTLDGILSPPPEAPISLWLFHRAAFADWTLEIGRRRTMGNPCSA
jgi:hypothetical protein